MLGPADSEQIVSTLDDLFAQRAARHGTGRARAWYWRQVMGFVPRLHRLRRQAGQPDRVAMTQTRAGWTFALEGAERGTRLALRSFRRQPSFAVLAITTLALGIGCSTAIFSVLHGVVIRPLSYPDPSSLVVVWPEMVSNMRMVGWLEENTRSLLAVSGISPFEFTITGDGEGERVGGARVTTNHFDVMGVRPVLGRTFLREESDPAASSVVVLSHGLWQSRYGGDPDVVGGTIQLNYRPHLVVGVMPADYRPLEAAYRLWVPEAVEPGTTVGTDETWWVRNRIARLAPGVSAERAQEELRIAVARLAAEFPEDIDGRDAARASVMPLQTALVGEFGRTLWILLAATGLVLLIACSNVANLLLARAAVKQREVALRAAIGATRRQVVAHLLTESLVLGVLAGAAGILLASLTLVLLRSTAPAGLPRIDEVTIDRTVLLFGVVLSLLTPLLIGLVPAHRANRLDVRELLAGSGRGSAGDGGPGRLASLLIAVEVALSVVLVIGATLMLKSVLNLSAVDPGFRTERILTLHVAIPPGSEGTDGPAMATYRRLWDELAATPGVESVGGIHLLPLTSGNNRYPFWAQDNEPEPGSRAPATNIRVATPGYIQTMGINLLDGRWFEDADRLESSPVLVINKALADRLWPGTSPIGKQIRLLDEESFAWQVVGVIANVNQMGLAREPGGEIYLPHEQWSWPGMYVTLRTRSDAASMVPAVRQAILRIDDDITISRVATMEDVVAASVASNRFVAGLISSFALMALVLGMIGVYGVMTYTISRRIPEFGVRIALGSSGARILRSAMLPGLGPVAIGVAAGAVVAWSTGRLLSSLLFGVQPADPATYLQVVGALIAAGCAASYLPARRACRVDPIRALRTD
jgi:predicted permease